MDGEKSMRPQPYAKNGRKLSNTKSDRNNFHGRAHKLAILPSNHPREHAQTPSCRPQIQVTFQLMKLFRLRKEKK